MASTRWLWTLGAFALTSIVTTVCLCTNYLGNTYMYSYSGAQNRSGFGHAFLQGAIMATLALVILFCTLMVLRHPKSVIGFQWLIVTFFAFTSMFVWIFFVKHSPQFWPTVGFMPIITQGLFTSIDRMYQLAVTSTLCGLIAALTMGAGLLSNSTAGKKAIIWMGLVVSVILPSGATFTYFRFLASPHHSEPDMWVARFLSQFRLELLSSFVALSLFTVILGWIGNRISGILSLKLGSVGFIVTVLGAALVHMKLNLITHKVMWDTMNQYDLRQLTYALLLCALVFGVVASLSIGQRKSRP